MLRSRVVVSVVLVAALAGCGRSGLTGVTARTGTAQALEASQPIGLSLLASLDLNHDGRIAATEASWLQEDFGAIDANRDGLASQAELDAYFQNTGRGQDAALLKPEAIAPGIIGGGVAGLAALGLAGYLTYTGLKGSHDFMYPKKETFAKPPSDYGYAFDEVPFKSHDGLKLAGWYVPADVPTTKGIVILHGHGSNKDTAFKKYGPMLHDHYNLFIFDQRYCGQSEGPYSTLGYLEDKDAAIAVQQLRERGNTSIGLMGESMGAAVAIDTGAQVPDVKAVWADCAFDSLYDAVEPRAKARKYPLPQLVAQSVNKTVALRSHCAVEQADPVRWVAKLAPRPLVIVHGQKDDETTPDNGEKLFLAAKEPKQIWRTPEARHAESWKLYPQEYAERMRTFFDDAL
ncbi:MAG: hypothetical protein JWM80_3067 [Cyanobacteria bacterium RYN_339]|nr:hypothetical protein [Cyanobacteria bacterium RYN_339]